MMLGFNKVMYLKRKETASIQELHDNYFSILRVFILFHTCIRSCTQMVAYKVKFISYQKCNQLNW